MTGLIRANFSPSLEQISQAGAPVSSPWPSTGGRASTGGPQQDPTPHTGFLLQHSGPPETFPKRVTLLKSQETHSSWPNTTSHC